MKKLVLTTALVAMTTSVFASSEKNWADKLIEFKKLELGHTKDWHNLMADLHVRKTKVVNEINQKWNSFGSDAIKKLAANNNVDDVFKETLNRAIALHKENKKLWKSWFEDFKNKSEKLAKDHAEQLKRFEDTLNK